MTLSPADDDLPDDVPASAMQGNPGHDEAGHLDRVRRIARYRRLGLTYDQIAQQMGYSSKSAPRQLLLRWLQSEPAENVNELRLLENERLDLGLQAVLPLVTMPIEGTPGLPENARTIDPRVKLRAVDSLVRLSARRSRLNGLDAPLQVAISTGATAELDDALALLESAVQRMVIPGEVVESHDDTTDDAEPTGTDAGAG